LNFTTVYIIFINYRVFHKLLYGQKQHQIPGTTNAASGNAKETVAKKKESPKDTKLKLFLKRSSEPILNGLPFNQQQVCRKLRTLSLILHILVFFHRIVAFHQSLLILSFIHKFFITHSIFYYLFISNFLSFRFKTLDHSLQCKRIKQ
jgi:hypothetical protein